MPGGGVLGRDDGGGKKERLVLGILWTTGEESEVCESRWWDAGARARAVSSLSVLCANNEATVSRSAWCALSRGT
jgi:hypothetical protein